MENYFMGNNTADGFKGFFEDEIEGKRKVYLLKGGPGTGKSTMMRKIGAECKVRGYDYELWFCSGDTDSIDGVYIKDINVLIMDATSPHAIEVKLPVVRDIIVNLADAIDDKILQKYRTEIDECLGNKKQFYFFAYQHLKIAKLYDDMYNYSQNKVEINAFDTKKILYVLELINKENGVENLICENDYSAKIVRNVFVKAISAQGETFLKNKFENKFIIGFSGSKKEIDKCFKTIANRIKTCIIIRNPLIWERIDGLIANNVILIDESCLRDMNIKENERIILDDVEDAHGEKRFFMECKNNQIMLACHCLQKAKECHKECESYYIKAQKVDALNKIYTKHAKNVFEN